MRKIRFVVLILLVATSFFISATVLASDFPAGTFEAGKVGVRFSKDGHVQFLSGTQVLVEGTFSVKGDQIRLTDQKGPMACASGETQSGTYRWALQSDTLTFAKVADQCDGRADDLTSQKWMRKKE